MVSIRELQLISYIIEYYYRIILNYIKWMACLNQGTPADILAQMKTHDCVITFTKVSPFAEVYFTTTIWDMFIIWDMFDL